MIPSTFPSEWYWLADDGRLYASAHQALVIDTDPSYIAFREKGGAPTRWPRDDMGEQTDAALSAVLAVHGLRLYPPSLEELRAVSTVAIDAEAERQRLRWITGGAGQAMTYARKVDEAVSVMANADPHPDDYPMLAADLGITGATLPAIAAVVLDMDAAWSRIGGAIERRRMVLKRDAATAADADALAAIDITSGWPEPEAPA